MDWRGRISHFRKEAFLKVNGPMAPGILDSIEVLQEMQEKHAIVGDILEIGVLHGRFFLALDCLKRDDEIAVAVDIFDDQYLNIDGSGKRSTLQVFKQNVQDYSPKAEHVRIEKADSLALGAHELRSFAKNKAFRLISVDGGHTPDHVLNDMSLAAETIVNGGVALLDDYYNPHWPGVHEGFVKYMMFATRKLAPFAFHANKLLLTTLSFHGAYLAYYRERMSSRPSYVIRDVTMSGFDAVVVQARGPGGRMRPPPPA